MSNYKEIVTKKGYKQKQLADLLNISEANLSKKIVTEKEKSVPKTSDLKVEKKVRLKNFHF